MPPIYTYKCDNCKDEVEIVRSMKDSDLMPEPEEEPKATECKQHIWKKIIKYAPEKVYGSGWGTRKGHH